MALPVFTTPKSRISRPKTLGAPKRIWFSREARDCLETVFTLDPYPDRETRDELADQLCVKSTKIREWFCNKRKRTKKLGLSFTPSEDSSPRPTAPHRDENDCSLLNVAVSSPVAYSTPKYPVARGYSDSDLEDMCEVDTEATSDDENHLILSLFSSLIKRSAKPRPDRSSTRTHCSRPSRWIPESPVTSFYVSDYTTEAPSDHRV